MPLPKWWNCDLAKLSMRLDDRWQVGFWTGDSAPAVPGEPCEACHRRASIFHVGGWEDAEDGDSSDGGDYLARRVVELCGWCRLAPEAVIENEQDLQRALRVAAEQSIAWRWQWRGP
jgi:hypothetical protein